MTLVLHNIYYTCVARYH